MELGSVFQQLIVCCEATIGQSSAKRQNTHLNDGNWYAFHFYLKQLKCEYLKPEDERSEESIRILWREVTAYGIKLKLFEKAGKVSETNQRLIQNLH